MKAGNLEHTAQFAGSYTGWSLSFPGLQLVYTSLGSSPGLRVFIAVFLLLFFGFALALFVWAVQAFPSERVSVFIVYSGGVWLSESGQSH